MKICLDCKIDKPEEEYYRDRTRLDGREPYCKTCKDIRRKKSYRGSSKQRETNAKKSRKRYQEKPETCRAMSRRSMARLTRRKKLFLLEQAGTRSCSRCGYDKHPAALQFHHRDPATKLFNVTAGKNLGMTEEMILAELAKCDVLCANCHFIETCTWERGWDD